MIHKVNRKIPDSRNLQVYPSSCPRYSHIQVMHQFYSLMSLIRHGPGRPMSCLLILLLSLSGLISSALVTRFDPGLPALSGASRSSRVQAASSFTSVNIPIVEENSHDRQQVEPTIAIDPRNPNIIVAGAQDYRLKDFGQHRWHGYYRSIDGGQTWTSRLLPGFPGDLSP